MQWFARGRLWATREAERDDFQLHKQATTAPRAPRADAPAGAERRGSDWRPGGAHKDPRDRFKKKNRPERAWSEKDPATQRDRDKPGYREKPAYTTAGPRKPWSDKPAGPPRGDRSWQDKPRERKPWSGKPAASAPPSDRPWQTKPTGPRAQRKPWVKPADAAPRGDRPWSGKPSGGPPRGDRPWSAKPAGGPPRGDRPWSSKPAGGPPRGDRPWSSKPPAGGAAKRPWSGKPRDPNRKPFAPRGPRPGAAPVDGPPRKRRNEDPDKD